MVFEDQATDAYGHAKLGGIGDRVASALKDASSEVQFRPSRWTCCTNSWAT